MSKFSEKAKSILATEKPASKPASMADFMSDDAPIEPPKKYGNTEIRKTVQTKDKILKREEFKLPEKLARALSDYAHLNKTKKVRVVIQALEKYFKDEQFTGLGGK